MKKIFKKNFGFSLLETLLGFLIFSIIMVVLYGTFFSGMKIEERSAGDSAIYHQVKMSFDAMGRELEEAAHFDFSSFPSGLQSFAGTSSEISFLTPGKNGLRVVRYALKDRPKTRIHQTLIGEHYKKNIAATTITQSEGEQITCLMRSEEPFVDFVSENNTSEENEEILFDNVRRDSLKISYAYLESKGERTYLVWQNVWDKEYVPSGIRLELTLTPASKDAPPIAVKKTIYIPTGFWGEAL
jgi:type II secretory pathway component PulJ